MKKTLVIAALVVGFGFFGWQQASANWGMGGHGMGMGAGCPKGGPGYAQLDQASKAKLDKYFDETKDLRRQLVMKHAEQRAILRTDNPDPAKAAKLAGEMFDLHSAMQAKAEAAGVEDLLGKACDGACPQGKAGMGPHHGRRMMMQGGPGADMDQPAPPAGVDAQ